MSRKKRTNSAIRGSLHPRSTLTEEAVINILQLLKKRVRSKVLAIDYNVNPATISYIRCGKTWTHISRLDYSISAPAPKVEKIKLSRPRNKKLTEERVIDIVRRLALGETQASIALIYGVSAPTISNINRGLIWRHIPRPPMPPKKIRIEKPQRVSRVKLSADIARDIRRRLENGETQAAIGVLYGISQTTVCSINRRTTWKRA